MLLERVGASGDLGNAPSALAALERRIDRARAELRADVSRDETTLRGLPVVGEGEQVGSGRG
jgi:hypothetical protein